MEVESSGQAADGRDMDVNEMTGKSIDKCSRQRKQ
jgi:hypothetical protein